ncbi:NAD(P)H-quinone dehydrogenase [Corynebacterium diphtheriae]|uniref:NAD(P)H-quinone dehydrogenase n=1 Tax=Corynebacterium diphtheriae TaxID=1717 RepID=UPI0002F76C13|nr:NAD(P)H-quinone dehydrogenase [Corynebacterium diphtheriae]OJI03806.1 NAD(P)H-quinone dehydrogenase [Corynebacterium diphtheriae]OWM44142.1 NAD(P)H-quinone dehydrogenase [Corynebacterium diphtheriae]OWM50603.1 NAD(P)H-quinone dehydrogenase [Corynebacterium diphtheriae]OWN44901.1 flavoprotein disulfide reductase [Corynebacterium diphtheriae bv. mitis]OWN63317.1 flavoprotein disulfide reductase [Corynebacterium diphtheriae bv. mitis]
MTRIVIIGGGPAGYEAALAGAKYGAEITIIEDRGLGGAAVINDCVPSKSFIAGANIKTDLRRADDMGLNKGIGEAHLLIDALNNRVQALAYEQSSDIRASMDAHGVRVIDGRGSFDDYNPKQTVHYIKVDRADGTTETIECDLVLIATGATPRILPDAQPDGERILTWRQIYGLNELPEHLIVVGSGVTGAEFVSAFAELGVKVTMVASRDRILPHDDADAADVLETVLAERGVALEKHARVDSVIRTEDGGVCVKTSDGREIFGSHALMTVGSVPNTKDLGLEKVGIETTRSGHIRVDRVSRTNVAGVYAGGDCTDLFPLASVAAMQGRIAMYHALGEGVKPIRMKTVATAVFTRPEIAAVGVTQKQIESGEVIARTVMLPLQTNPRAKMRSLRHGFVKMFCRKNSGIVIGGVVVAPTASELILPIAVAVTNQLTVSDLAESFAVYPSLSGSITEAARQLMQHDDLQ